MWTALGVTAVCLAPLASAETAPPLTATASTDAQGHAARGITVRPASRGSLPHRLLRRSIPGATDAQQRGNRQLLPALGHHRTTTSTAVLAGGTRIGPLPCFVAPVGRCSARQEQRRGICFEDQQQQQHRRPITPPSARRPRCARRSCVCV